VLGCFVEAIKSGGWRAAPGVAHPCGRTTAGEALGLTPQTVEEVDRMSLAEIRQLRAVIEREQNPPLGG
jgi:hypothetical protein